jgi:hypothetical protein
MDYVIITLLTSMAVCYFVELLATLLRRGNLFRNLATFAATSAAIWYLAPHSLIGVVVLFATAFLATTLRIAVDRLTSKPQVITHRL